MKLLDCESIETTYSSLEAILGIGTKAINRVFDEVDIERFCCNNPLGLQLQYDQAVFAAVTGSVDLSTRFDQVSWFHLTRTANSESFYQGILPLNEQQDSIWNFLYSLIQAEFSKEEWVSFRRNLGRSHAAYLYHLKTEGSIHWGPFAVLVRDIAFRSKEVGNHNYLRVPEIVEDICLCFSDRYGIDLLPAYLDRTRPCIVKFTDDDAREDCVVAALYYLYCAFHGYSYSKDCNTCFDGGGKAIPNERILRVETVSTDLGIGGSR